VGSDFHHHPRYEVALGIISKNSNRWWGWELLSFRLPPGNNVFEKTVKQNLAVVGVSEIKLA